MIDAPVRDPEITRVLVDRIKADNEAEGKRPKAFDTFGRHSDAGKCLRLIQMRSLGFPKSDPMDLAGHWVTWVGRLVHEQFQSALVEHYGPDVVAIEVKVRHADLCSGHIDALIVFRFADEWVVCFELKTKGSMGFERSMGYRKRSNPWTRKPPEGPGQMAIRQGSLNALAIGADELRIGVLGLEAVGKPYAEYFGLSETDRIMGEWSYDRETFTAYALAELERFAELTSWTEANQLAPRWGIDDDGRQITLDPTKENRHWQCDYCDFAQTCAELGPSQVVLNVPKKRERQP